MKFEKEIEPKGLTFKETVQFYILRLWFYRQLGFNWVFTDKQEARAKEAWRNGRG